MITHPLTQELDELPGRLFQFLRAIGTVSEIRRALRPAGYTASEHAAGWSLLHLVSGIRAPFSASSRDEPAKEAGAELAAWAEAAFQCGRAAIERIHPRVAEVAFAGLMPVHQADAVRKVEIYLDWLEAFDDPEALATIASRGITAQERRRLRRLIEIARGSSTAVLPAHEPGDQTFGAVTFWYGHWSDRARALVTRPDHLARLGLCAAGCMSGAAPNSVPATLRTPAPPVAHRTRCARRFRKGGV